MSVKKFMQQVHRESSMSQTVGVRATVAPKPKMIKTEEPEVPKEAVEEMAQVQQEVLEEPMIQGKPVIPAQINPSTDISTPIQQIARPDIALERYGVNPWKSNFNIYNKDIVNFVRNFSAENQLNGGSAITKSQMIEVLLDVVFYDMQLKPEGFQSVQELRKHLQEKLR